MTRIFLTLVLIFSAAISHADDTFYGKYRLFIEGMGYNVGAEFLVNSKDEVTTVAIFSPDRNEWEATEDDNYVTLTRVPKVSDFVIETDQVTFSFVDGSDEDSLGAYVTLAWLRDGDEKTLTVVSNYSVNTDGPNSLVGAAANHVTVEKWNTKTKQWEELPGIN